MEDTKVVIYVDGGCVTSVTSNNQNVSVTIVDRDNQEEALDNEDRPLADDEDYSDCIHEVY